ncbi:nuclease homologue [Stappia sp. ES.058]|nr:nuclease homologue [Stappia sp. ES.058]
MGLGLALVAIAGAWLMDGDLPAGDPLQDNKATTPSPTPLPETNATTGRSAPPDPLPPAPMPQSIRNVTTADILPPPPVTGPLKRVEARLPEQPKIEVPDELTFRRPLVVDAGTLRHKTLTIRLAGLDAPKVSETCPSRLGGSWPCGRRARTALRAFVRRRAVTCDQVSEIASGLVAAQCRRQDTDLSEWMIAQGWARPEPDAAASLHEASKAARAKRKGIWQLDWRGDLDRPGATASDAPSPSRPGDGSRPAADPGDASLEGLLGDVEIVDTPWHPQSGDAADGQSPDTRQDAQDALTR